MEEGRERLPRCATCGLEIEWKPVLVDGKAYCCGGCAQGGPCYCSYDAREQIAPVAAGAGRRGRPDAPTSQAERRGL
ncbi:MAG: hypothetical protein M0Z94_03650 [Dehalococcoidales bacterium]|nr:hypothetical protein [Dehalococcoidales bacterium]